MDFLVFDLGPFWDGLLMRFKMDFKKTTIKELVTALTINASNFYYLHKRNIPAIDLVNSLDARDLKRYFVEIRGPAAKHSNFLQWGEKRLHLTKIKVYQYKNLFLVEGEFCFCLYELNFFWESCRNKVIF